MMPKSKEELRNLVDQSMKDTYEDLTPQLIMLIDQTKKNKDLTEAEKNDEIMLHMMGFVKTCTNEILIDVLSQILGLD